MKQLLIILFSFLLAMPTYADTASYSRARTEEFKLHYRFDRTEIDLTYRNNSQTADILKDRLLNTARIDSIIAYVSSSPDGQYAYNILLARRRAAKAEKFIRQLISEQAGNAQGISDGNAKDIAVKTVVIEENWSGFISLIEEDYFRHDRDKVIEILHRENIGNDARKALLEELDNGKTWGYILWKYMPQLRNATVITLKLKPVAPLPKVLQMCAKAVTDQDRPLAVLDFAEPAAAQPAATQPTAAPKAEPATEYLTPEVTPEQREDTPAHQPVKAEQPTAAGQQQVQPLTALWALRTNLLVPALNIGAEFPIGDSWSVSADYYFPWIWPSKTNRNCFELLGWSVEGRYWFGNDRQPQQRLRGHSVGLYAAGGYYDLEWNYKGQQGEFISTGLDYTYAMAICKRKRLNLEFTLAAGYIRSWGRNYTVPGANGELYPEPGIVIFDYVGPTKAAVSLVVPFEKWPWTALKARSKAKAEKEGRR